MVCYEYKSWYGNQSETGVSFVTTEDCNFKFSSSYDPMTISVYESANNIPVTYLLKKVLELQVA